MGVDEDRMYDLLKVATQAGKDGSLNVGKYVDCQFFSLSWRSDANGGCSAVTDGLKTQVKVRAKRIIYLIDYDANEELGCQACGCSC